MVFHDGFEGIINGEKPTQKFSSIKTVAFCNKSESMDDKSHCAGFFPLWSNRVGKKWEVSGQFASSQSVKSYHWNRLMSPLLRVVTWERKLKQITWLAIATVTTKEPVKIMNATKCKKGKSVPSLACQSNIWKRKKKLVFYPLDIPHNAICHVCWGGFLEPKALS